MTLAALRKKVHSQVDKADEAQLITMLRVVGQEVQLPLLPYDEEFRAELVQRVEDIRSGRTHTISAAESRARLDKMLSDAKGK